MNNSILYLFLNLFNECKRLIYIFIFITVLILSLAYYMFYNKNIEITSEMEVYPTTKIDTLYLDKYLFDLNNFFSQSTNADFLLNNKDIFFEDFHPDTIIELFWQNLRSVDIKQVINQSGFLQKYSNEVQDQYLSLIVNSFVAKSVAISHDKKQYNIIVKSFNEGDTKIILDAIFKEAENLSKIQINEIFNFYFEFLNEKLEEEIQIAENKINNTKILEKTIKNNLLFEQTENKENFNLNLDGQDYILNHNTSLANTLGLRVTLKGETQNKSGEIPNYLSDLVKGSIVLENELNIIKNKKNKTGMLFKSLNIDQINNKIQSMRMISYSVNSISATYAYNKNVVMIISFFISFMTYVLICLISLAYREKI